MNSDERARQQTEDEWLAELDSGKPVMPASQRNVTRISTESTLRKFVFDSHRTTRKGSLVVSFIDLDTGQEFVSFFNADIKRQRGPQKGESYRSGVGGQFLTRPRSKFRKLWLSATGKPPIRWASVYKSMRSQLGGIVFTGEPSVGYDSDEKPFNKLLDPEPLKKTIWEQSRNN